MAELYHSLGHWRNFDRLGEFYIQLVEDISIESTRVFYRGVESTVVDTRTG